MILSFKDEGTRDVYEGNDTRDARQTCPQHLWNVAVRKLHHLDAAVTLLELTEPPGNRLEKLTGNRAGQWSIRVNLQYRICFRWMEKGFAAVEITDYH
jgi:proteic killer suppression protein